ncbi:MAG: nucleoside-diphosphate kinase [Candidatus Woesearchaeota archaeon]|nr:nucleoside-diphosphate kinase [Candidatus Woesearchaeota archaeon]
MAEASKEKVEERNSFIEHTLVLMKPDAVQRGIVGKIVERFENVGLKIVAMKMIKANIDLAMKHYPKEMMPILGSKTLKDWDEMGIKTEMTADELGKMAWEDLIKFSTEAPIIAIVLEGVHAVEIVRKMCGTTSPHRAPPGTIRGDFSPISMGYATKRGFGGRNLIHASGSKAEAEKEIYLWFNINEIYAYRTVYENQVQ